MLSKNDLKNAITTKNRGISATDTDRQVIASIVARIEDANPTPEPLAAPELLSGNWRLLYTTSSELLGIDNFPLVNLGEIYQCIRPDQGRIYNIAEVTSLPFCEGLVSVVASFTPAEAEPVAGATNSIGTETPAAGSDNTVAVAVPSKRRVSVKFDRAVFGLQRALGYQSPDQHIENLESTPKFNLLQGVDFEIKADREPGWLEVTYLDKDLRIGRGNQGSLFVLTKD